MTPIDAYLAELRSALGDRLPPSIHEARLRETRAHLLSSTEDVGEKEAIRRYGRPRIVANGLVRAHRRYDSKSSWRLALPLAAAFALLGTLTTGIAFYLHSNALPIQPWMLVAMRWHIIAVLLCFTVRIVQTRRWLVGPFLAANVVGTVLSLLIVQQIGPTPVLPTFWTDLLIGFVRAGIIWSILNALALGIGRLLDFRPVGRAR